MSYSDIQQSLQAIYKIQEVDLSKVKSFGVKEAVAIDKPKKSSEFIQEELDLGKGFRSFLEPLYLDNPIQVLALPRLIEKGVLDHGYSKIRDLIPVEKWEEVLLKALGKNQVETVRAHIEAYLKKHPQRRDRKIDFNSFLIQMTYGLDRKTAALLLEGHGLGSLFELTPLESSDLKRQVKDCVRVAKIGDDFLRSPNYRDALVRFETIIRDIGDAFFKHWVADRNVVTAPEIEERFCRKALDPKQAYLAIQFLDRFFLPKERWNLGLIREGDLYFATHGAQVRFHQIYAHINPFFNYRGARYQVSELYRLAQHESRIDFFIFSEEELKKVLFPLKEFHLSKDKRGNLCVEKRSSNGKKNFDHWSLGANRL